MRIAIPLANGRLSMHFGHCDGFAMMDVDTEGKRILKRDDLDSPPHQPGLLPGWLAEQGASMIISGGMGSRAQELFSKHGIGVIVGAPADSPEAVVEAFLNGTLRLGGNACDH
jgi:predicted Fe-Mo cluster-binding NifX family protein